jgi:hypothetical protein
MDTTIDSRDDFFKMVKQIDKMILAIASDDDRVA